MHLARNEQTLLLHSPWNQMFQDRWISAPRATAGTNRKACIHASSVIWPFPLSKRPLSLSLSLSLPVSSTIDPPPYRKRIRREHFHNMWGAYRSRPSLSFRTIRTRKLGSRPFNTPWKIPFTHSPSFREEEGRDLPPNFPTAGKASIIGPILES